MLRPRVIPILSLSGGRLVKTIRFRNPIYIGDPINATRILNEKEVDELALIDIHATKNKSEPPFQTIQKIAEQCFMPLSYGGGVDSLEKAKRIFGLGVEKIVLGTAAIKNPRLTHHIATTFGSQSVAVCLDYQTDWLGRDRVYISNGTYNIGLSPETVAVTQVNSGAGELILQSIKNDGMRCGFDLKVLKSIAKIVSVPVIALGGAGTLQDLQTAFGSGASGVAAGSLFALQPPHNAVLISYLSRNQIEALNQGRNSCDL
jgi:cyclase